MSVSKVSDFKSSYDQFLTTFELPVPGFSEGNLTLKVRRISLFEIQKMGELQNQVEKDILPGDKEKVPTRTPSELANENFDRVLAKCVMEPTYEDIKPYLVFEQKEYIINHVVIDDVTEADLEIVADAEKK